MPGSTTKKVLVTRFDRETLAGYVNPQTFLTGAGVELLSLAGSVLIVPFDEVKAVCFVRDFNTSEPSLEVRHFPNRPKQEGLWIRMTFRNDEVLEGVLPNNLLQIEAAGFTVIPPDPGHQKQRLFVPRAALSEIRVLGVVGGLTRRGVRGQAPAKDQIELFGG